MTPEKQMRYRRLSRRATFEGWGGYSLWLGADHLLLIEHAVFMESYRRFNLSDIQAIQCRRTPTGRTVHLLLGAVAVLIGAWIVWVQDRGARVAIASFLGAPLLIGWMVHFWRGATCRFVIQTAVGQTVLPCVSRVRMALRLMERLSQLIEQTQPPVTEVERQAHASAAVEPTPAPLPPRPPPVPVPVEISIGRVNVNVYVLMLAFGLIQGVTLFYHNAALGYLSLVAAGGLGVAGLFVRLRPVYRHLKAGWLALGLCGLAVVTAGIGFFFLIVDYPAEKSWGELIGRWLSEPALARGAVLPFALQSGLCLVALTAGLIGLVAARRAARWA